VSFVSDTVRVHRIPFRVRDDREPPSWERDGGDVELIWVGRKPEYFFRHDWTGEISLIGKANFVFRRTGKRRGMALPTLVIASEAKQSIARQEGRAPS
jgi:hypothetical protein